MPSMQEVGFMTWQRGGAVPEVLWRLALACPAPWGLALDIGKGHGPRRAREIPYSASSEASPTCDSQTSACPAPHLHKGGSGDTLLPSSSCQASSTKHKVGKASPRAFWSRETRSAAGFPWSLCLCHSPSAVTREPWLLCARFGAHRRLWPPLQATMN